MSDPITLGYIAQFVNGRLTGDPDCPITSAGSIDDAGEGQITFAEKGAAQKSVSQTKAAAVLVPPGFDKPGINLIHVDNPRLAFAKVLDLFRPPAGVAIGVHPSAAMSLLLQGLSSETGLPSVIG